MIKRSDIISLLRVIATLMVVAVYCGQALPLPSLMHQIVLRGKYGVVLFYVLCGFLALKSLSYNNSAKEYYKKRLFRIVPIYYLNLFINILIAALFGEFTLQEGYKWIRYFFFAQSILPSRNVGMWNNYCALWSMSPIFVFYILAPFVYWLIQKKKTSSYLLLMGGVSY